jgi:transposase
MLKKPSPQQTALEMVSLNGLVPNDHLLRKIDAVVDFSFIHDRVAGLYCPDNGRPPLDPTLMFKALFIGYLFGIRSARQLVREIEVNVAYRWFLGLKLTDQALCCFLISSPTDSISRLCLSVGRLAPFGILCLSVGQLTPFLQNCYRSRAQRVAWQPKTLCPEPKK